MDFGSRVEEFHHEYVPLTNYSPTSTSPPPEKQKPHFSRPHLEEKKKRGWDGMGWDLWMSPPPQEFQMIVSLLFSPNQSIHGGRDLEGFFLASLINNVMSSIYGVEATLDIFR